MSNKLPRLFCIFCGSGYLSHCLGSILCLWVPESFISKVRSDCTMFCAYARTVFCVYACALLLVGAHGCTGWFEDNIKLTGFTHIFSSISTGFFFRFLEFRQKVINIYLIRYGACSDNPLLSVFFMMWYYLDSIFDSEHLISDVYAVWYPLHFHFPMILHPKRFRH